MNVVGSLKAFTGLAKLRLSYIAYTDEKVPRKNWFDIANKIYFLESHPMKDIIEKI